MTGEMAVRVFLGSTDWELSKDMMRVEDSLTPVQDICWSQHVGLDVITAPSVGRELRRELERSDIAVFLFGSAISEYARDEIRLVLDRYEKAGTPRPLLFFKSSARSYDADSPLEGFRQDVERQGRVSCRAYEDTDSVSLSIIMAIRDCAPHSLDVAMSCGADGCLQCGDVSCGLVRITDTAAFSGDAGRRELVRHRDDLAAELRDVSRSLETATGGQREELLGRREQVRAALDAATSRLSEQGAQVLDVLRGVERCLADRSTSPERRREVTRLINGGRALDALALLDPQDIDARVRRFAGDLVQKRAEEHDSEVRARTEAARVLSGAAKTLSRARALAPDWRPGMAGVEPPDAEIRARMLSYLSIAWGQIRKVVPDASEQACARLRDGLEASGKLASVVSALADAVMLYDELASMAGGYAPDFAPALEGVRSVSERLLGRDPDADRVMRQRHIALSKFGFAVEVWGDRAIFTNPNPMRSGVHDLSSPVPVRDSELDPETLGPVVVTEKRQEDKGRVAMRRATYDVMTPSAARGIVEAIYWHPGMEVRIDCIYVLNEIHKETIELNGRPLAEIQTDLVRSENRYMGSRGTPALQQSEVLKDVRYVIVGHLEFDPSRANEDDSIEKFNVMLKRRLAKGQCFRQPFLGKREFPARFRAYEGPLPPLGFYSSVPEVDLGSLLLDMDYRQVDACGRFRKVSGYGPQVGNAEGESAAPAAHVTAGAEPEQSGAPEGEPGHSVTPIFYHARLRRGCLDVTPAWRAYEARSGRLSLG